MAPLYSYTKTLQVSQNMTVWDDFIDVVKFKHCQLDAFKSNLTVVPQRDQQGITKNSQAQSTAL